MTAKSLATTTPPTPIPFLYDDDDQEVLSYEDLQYILPESPLYDQTAICSSLAYAFHTAIDDAAKEIKLMYSEPLTYKQATSAPDADDWKAAMDLEMSKLRALRCWDVVRKSDLPPNAKVMRGKWIYKYKI